MYLFDFYLYYIFNNSTRVIWRVWRVVGGVNSSARVPSWSERNGDGETDGLSQLWCCVNTLQCMQRYNKLPFLPQSSLVRCNPISLLLLLLACPPHPTLPHYAALNYIVVINWLVISLDVVCSPQSFPIFVVCYHLTHFFARHLRHPVYSN